VPRLTFRTSYKVKRSKVKVTRPLNAVTENTAISSEMESPKNFELGLRTEHEDLR